MSTVDVLVEIGEERARQDAKWGEQNHPDGTGPKVAWGRLAHAEDHVRDARLACQSAAARGDVTWRHIAQEKIYEAFAETDPANLRAELIQVAAVAVAWVQAIDRRAAVVPTPPESAPTSSAQGDEGGAESPTSAPPATPH